MMAHLTACTVAALAALAAAWALGRGPARWRYGLLLAALLRFAVPTAWLDAAGRSIAPVLPAPGRPPQAMEDLRRLLVHPGAVAPAPGIPAQSGASSLFAVLWAAGAAACLGPWSRRLRLRPPAARLPDAGESEAFDRARRVLGIERAVELRIVPAEWVPGAVGLWHPSVVLPEGLAAQLNGPELDAVLAHELAHILRRDNLWAAVAHGVVAVFWFHPLLWWIERWMLKERETACDELVLGRGTHPEVYLSGILKVCRMAFGGAEGYAGANGSNLQIRMERIMSTNVPRPSRMLRAAVGALVTLAALFPLAGGYLRAQPQVSAADRAQADSLFQQGVAASTQRQYDEAERAFRRSYELDPENSRALLGVVEVLIATGRGDEALRFAQQEAARHPGKTELQMALGNAAVKLGSYDLGLAQYERVLNSYDRNDARRGDIYLRIGEIYRRMGDNQQAITVLRQAVETQPVSIPALSTLALTLDSAGQTDEAGEFYRKVLARDPGNGVALNNLAYLLAAHGGDLDEALDYVQQARKALPELTEVVDTLGYVYLARKSGAEAFSAFREAVLKNPADRNFRSHLLLAIEQKGDRSATAEALRTALRDEPTEVNQELVKKLLQ